MRQTVRRTIAAAVSAAAATVLAAAAAGCGTQSHRVPQRPRMSRLTAAAPVWWPRAPLVAGAPAWMGAAPVGEAQRVQTQGSRLRVNVRGVVDPLRGSGTTLPAGTRAVAVFVQIRNSGPAIYDSSATGDFGLRVSGGLVTPLEVPRGSCRTPVEDFDRYITAGEDRVGCVAFAVRRGARVEQVTFSPHAQRRGQLRWRL